MFEDQHRVRIGECRGEHEPRVFQCRRGQDLKAWDVGVPAFETVRVLRRELAAGTGGHANDDRYFELPARHVPDRCRVVDDLVECQEAEIDRHDLDDRAHPAERGADPGADKGRFGERRVADALGAELVEQALGNRIAAAVAPDILAHQKDARISQQRLADRFTDRIAVGDLASPVGHGASSPA